MDYSTKLFKMKLSFYTYILGLSICLFSCCQNTASVNSTSDSPIYDSVSAKNYGADDYGMKQYVIAFLKVGPNRDLPKEEAQKLQMAHLQNIGKMAEEGKLAVAGPFLGTGELRGIYIFNVASLAEAEELTATDPAIKAGSLVMELKEWYGSAALMAVNDIHTTLTKKAITE